MNLPRILPRRRLLAAAALALVPEARALGQPAGPVIAAASDLQSALPQIAEAFRARTGKRVRLTFGSSGNFTQQIVNGAPFEVFLSADEAYVARLAELGRTDGAGDLYAIGRLGVFAHRRSPVRADSTMADLRAAARDGRLRRLAIANPEHAPYGRAAREALQHAGLWTFVEPRLVLGENVSQATQFVTSRSADAGIIPLSLAVTPQVRAAGLFALIPAHWHRPLRQRLVLLKGAGADARAFYAFVKGPEARAIFIRSGFSLPR